MPTRFTRSRTASFRTALTFVYLTAVCVVAAVVALHVVTDIPIARLTRDVTSLAGVPAYTGALSTLGILLWCATAAICLFTFFVLHTSGRGAGPKVFVLASGLLTALLLLDDAFVLHENLPEKLGISDNWLFGFYVAATLYLVTAARRVIVGTRYGALLVAAGFLAASMVVDKLDDYNLLQDVGVGTADMMFLLEDGLKFLGIAGWFGYYAWTCSVFLNGTVPDRPPRAQPQRPGVEASARTAAVH